MARLVRENMDDMDEHDRRNAFSYNERQMENECEQQGKTFISGYKKEDATYVHGHCREKTASERDDDRKRTEEIREIMSKYPSKPKLKYREALGGGDYVNVYEPMNPIEAVTGGKVKFTHEHNKPQKKKQNRRRK